MTKAALVGLTRGLARELGPRGITVNVIQPGPTATDANPDSGPFADEMRQLTAVGHYGPRTSPVRWLTWRVQKLDSSLASPGMSTADSPPDAVVTRCAPILSPAARGALASERRRQCDVVGSVRFSVLLPRYSDNGLTVPPLGLEPRLCGF